MTARPLTLDPGLDPEFALAMAASAVRRHWRDVAAATEPLDRAAAERALRALGILARLQLPTRRLWVDSPDDVPTLARREGLGEQWPVDWLDCTELLEFEDGLGSVPPTHAPRFWRDLQADAPLPPNFAAAAAVPGAAGFALAEVFGKKLSAVARAALLVAESLHAVWLFDDAVVLCERPIEVRLDDDGELHAEDGPAVRYRGGPSVHAWHGEPVPAWVIESPASLRILHEPDPFVRRIAIERAGWPALLRGLRLPVLGACPDPANPGRELRLHRVPRRLARGLYDGAANVLVMTNGSPSRDGSFAEFAEVVPGTCRHPLDAAAWQYGVDPDVYARLARRT